MATEAPSKRAEVLDLDFVAPFDEKAQREADLLVQTAKVHQEQNDYEGAVRFLKQAAVVIGGKDPERQHMVLAFLKEVGGKQAVDEVKGDMRRAIGAQIAKVQEELIRIGDWQYKEALQQQGPDAVENNEKLIAALKTKNQRLSDEKAAFME